MDAKFNFLATILISLFLSGIGSARADSSDLDADEAARFVRERNAGKVQAQAASKSLSMRTAVLEDRGYKVGDKWLTAVTYFEHGQVRKNSIESEIKTFETTDQFILFRVEEIDSRSGGARVTVVACDSNGEVLPGAKVRQISLGFRSISDRSPFSGILARSGQGQEIVSELVGADAYKSAGGFDGFPFRIPMLRSSKMRSFNSSTQFEAHDFLMRKVSVSWKRGDLWPTQIESAVGTMRLLKQEKMK